jgi:flagellar FliL protein
MADENEKEQVQEEKPEESPKKKSKVPTILLITAIVLFQIGISFFIVTKVLFKGDKEGAVAEEVEDANVEFGPVFEVQDIVVNLADTQGMRFLKLSLTLETTSKDVVEELTTKKPIFMDILISILSAKRLSDVDTREEKEALRFEIVDSCNAKLKSGKVKYLYFTDFVIQ